MYKRIILFSSSGPLGHGPAIWDFWNGKLLMRPFVTFNRPSFGITILGMVPSTVRWVPFLAGQLENVFSMGNSQVST